MIKKLMAVAGLAVVVSTGSFVAPERAQAAPDLVRTPYLEITTTRNLDACQLKQYSSCMQKFMDHTMCYESAQSYECPPE